MFYVLKIENRNSTLFENLFGKYVKDKYKVQSVPVYKGAPFMMMTVTVGKRGVSWDDVIKVMGKCALRLVVSENITLPQNDNIGLFKGRALYDKMMENTFLQILKNNRNQPISVLDRHGQHSDYVKKLAKYCDALSIATDNKKEYLTVCESIIEESGLCPTITTDFKDSKIKINCDENNMTIICENECLNISNGCEFQVPNIYQNILPENVCKYDFYSALYELCGVFSLADCFFDNMNVNNEKKAISDITFT